MEGQRISPMRRFRQSLSGAPAAERRHGTFDDARRLARWLDGAIIAESINDGGADRLSPFAAQPTARRLRGAGNTAGFALKRYKQQSCTGIYRAAGSEKSDHYLTHAGELSLY